MHIYAWIIAIAALLAVDIAAQPQESFLETRDCQNDQVCTYGYQAMQEDFKEDVKLNTTIRTTVLASCDAVGEYAGRAASRYCLTFKDTDIVFSGPQEESDESGSGSGDDGPIPEGTADRLLAGWFCFVQTDSGKVVAVYHSRDDLPDIINFKKSVASAFQSNFKHTEEEEEEDPQSRHRAHYSYDDSGDRNVVHRIFDSSDIIGFPFDIPKDDVELMKDEYQTYRSRVLEHASGYVYVNVIPPAKDESATSKRETAERDDEETFDGHFQTSEFAVRGSYRLDLQYCNNIPRVRERKRREIRMNMRSGYFQSALTALYNRTAASHQQMEQLREVLPSIEDTLSALHSNPMDSKTGNSLGRLLQLEAQYDVLPGYTAALDPVLMYLDKILLSEDPDDLQMRLVIYSLLAEEGSPRSQEALVHVLERLSDEKEINTLITMFAFTRNPSTQFISHLEKRIGPDPLSTDPMLLSYGALGLAASAEKRQHIVQFLQSRLSVATNDTVALVHLIHSLSNTGDNSSVKVFIRFLYHSSDIVKLAAINGLRMHTNNKLVQAEFVKLLNKPELTEEEFEAIVLSLMFGLEHRKLQRLKYVNSDLLLTSLVSAAVKLDNSDIHQLLISYILALNSETSYQHLMVLKAQPFSTDMVKNGTNPRQKRGWDWDESNSDYDLVASYSSRRSDVSTYPHHKAYIWGKKFGVSELYCQVSAGGFVGVDNDCSHFKLFGKASAKGHAFGRSATVFHAEVLVLKENTNWRAKLYAQIAGRVLANSDNRYSSPSWRYDWPLYSSPRYTLISFEYPIFIFVGILRFDVGVYAQIQVDSNVEASIESDVCSASAALIPKVILTASASASASLLELIRGGIRVSASITYQLELELSARVCIPTLQVQNCLNVYDEWPNNYVEIYAYYQHRNIKWCKLWIVPYPCGFSWSSEHRWDSASKRWDLSSRPKRSIWSSCDADMQSCGSVTLPQQNPTWPDGTYALPKPRNGCPDTRSHFSWAEGWRYQDTEDSNNINSFSSYLSQRLSGQFDSNIQINYCVKTSTYGDTGIHWPQGSYCIAKRGQCPQGFGQGSVYWDDEDNNNVNSYGGTIPDGSYGRDTRIYYCCRNDRHPSTEIVLPTSSPFFLMRMHQDGCQKVKGMTNTMEYVFWDDEDNRNANSLSSPHPYHGGDSRNHKLYFCYYY